MIAKRFIDVIAGVLVAAGLSMASTSSYAFAGFLTTLRASFPLVPSTQAAGGCAYCHTDNNDPGGRNAFGNAFDNAGLTITAALRAADSDGDGASNNTELTTAAANGFAFNPGVASSTPPTATSSTTSTTTTTTSTTAPTTTTTAATTTTTAASTTTTTSTSPTTTTTASTTTTTLASGGAALYSSFCASCHDGAAADGGGRNVLGARTCAIDGAINGTSVFPGGVPAMQFLKGILSATQIQAISDFLNSGTVTDQQRYITTCAGCHGADARGGRTGEGVRGASRGEIREAIGDEREMRYLRCLPRSDVNAIGSYLRGIRRNGDRDHDDDDD